MKALNLKLTPEKGAALYEALDTVIYIGNDFASDKSTMEEKQWVISQKKLSGKTIKDC